MAYVFHFSPDAMSKERYDEIIRQLDAVGAGAPEGRVYHACYGSADRLRVFDVWTSPEAFEQFGATLLPILQSVGVDPGQPEVVETHNLIAG